MSDRKQKTEKTDNTFDFSTKKKVSIWVSQHPYKDIPDEYFEETFSRNNTRATNLWSKNYRIKYFKPDDLETNGAESGTIDVKSAAAECSFSSSFMNPLMNRARKKKINDITWMILIYEMEYNSKLTGTESDEFTKFMGAFNYDDSADSLTDVADKPANDPFSFKK